MITIKIISNPYKKQIRFQKLSEDGCEWKNIDYMNNPNSRLLRNEITEGFFPFKAKQIVRDITEEYGVTGEPIKIIFEGSADEYDEFKDVCADDSYAVKLVIEKSSKDLANARDILPEVKKLFQTMNPLIVQSVSQDKIKYDLGRFSDAASDVVPICVLGNYSTGKSTFINALIGSEILPSGSEPVTAKVYKISRSKYRDRAIIRCAYHNYAISITFTETETLIDATPVENHLYLLLKETLYPMTGESIVKRVNKTLSIINDIENQTEEIVISDLIEVEIPFASGVLANSLHPFVIFDTPGSNSVTNVKHLHVLKEAMANMTNGLPIFLSTPDALDSTDNEDLYTIIRELDELDNRFTMIVVNKADGAGIQRRSATEQEQNRILSQAVPRNLYSGGLFYVSSILGLGAKTDGNFYDYVYEDVYDAQVSRYRDPDNRHYRNLYLFNIMPEQIKRRSDALAAEQPNLIYANSGLFSIETEIETFAGKYAAYNKCFQSQLFLRKVIQITEEEILSQKAGCEEIRQSIRDKLEEEKKSLIDRLETTAVEEQVRYQNNYQPHMSEYLELTEETFSFDDLKELEASFIETQADKLAFEDHEQEVKHARSSAAAHLKTNLRQVVQNRRLNLSAVMTAAYGLASDMGTVTEKTRAQREIRREIDKAASDDLMQYISRDFEVKLSKFNRVLDSQSKAFWSRSTEEIRDLLAGIVSGSDTLTDERRKELERIIITYKPISFDEKSSEQLFNKDEFERRFRIMNITIWQSNHLDIGKLVNAYNSNMEQSVMSLYQSVADSHRESADNWIRSLLDEIYENIVAYSPELSKQARLIENMTVQINGLVERQEQLKKYTKQLDAMMDWTEI